MIPIWFIAWLILLWISNIDNKEDRKAWYIVFAIIAVIVLIAMSEAGFTLRYR